MSDNTVQPQKGYYTICVVKNKGADQLSISAFVNCPLPIDSIIHVHLCSLFQKPKLGMLLHVSAEDLMIFDDNSKIIFVKSS